MIAQDIHVIIFHGTGGSPDGNWFAWLAEELSKLSCKVSRPKLPTPEGQTLDNWQNAFKDQIGKLESNMILIGHSMGAGFAMRLLEQAVAPITASFLVAGWDGLLHSEEFDPLIKSFYQTEFNYQQIQKNMGECYQYHGDDDPYVPLSMAKDLAVSLAVSLQLIEGAGHINSESGYKEFPLLLKDLKQLLTRSV